MNPARRVFGVILGAVIKLKEKWPECRFKALTGLVKGL